MPDPVAIPPRVDFHAEPRADYQFIAAIDPDAPELQTVDRSDVGNVVVIQHGSAEPGMKSRGMAGDDEVMSGGGGEVEIFNVRDVCADLLAKATPTGGEAIFETTRAVGAGGSVTIRIKDDGLTLAKPGEGPTSDGYRYLSSDDEITVILSGKDNGIQKTRTFSYDYAKQQFVAEEDTASK